MSEPVLHQEMIEDAEWIESKEYSGLLDLRAGDGTLLAWIQKRPSYCDRGHYHGQIEYSPGNPMDAADGMPQYYMRLDVAKQELREKLLWRLCKIRAGTG